jgi:hypothetical protein
MLLPGHVAAQQDVTLEALNVALWPEYDRSEMLVIYKLLWSSTVTLPAEVSLRIPAGAELNALAERAVDGGLYNVAPEREVHGEWAVITFLATMPEAQIEYYDPGLQIDGAVRQYTYQWPGDYAVDTLSFQVQQPAGAIDFSIEPGLGDSIQGSDTLLYYGAEVGTVPAGEPFFLDINYEKSSDALSVELVELIQVQPAEPIDLDTPGRVSLTDSLSNWLVPVLLGSLGLALIAGSGFWFWRSGRRPTPPHPPRRGRRATSVNLDNEVADGGVYCHHCGKRASGGDRFCRACGMQLRVQ